MTPIDAGYEGEDPLRSDEAEVTFDLRREDRFFAVGSIAVVLMRNDTPSGLLYFKSEKEYEWFRDQIKGTYKPND